MKIVVRSRWVIDQQKTDGMYDNDEEDNDDEDDDDDYGDDGDGDDDRDDDENWSGIKEGDWWAKDRWENDYSPRLYWCLTHHRLPIIIIVIVTVLLPKVQNNSNLATLNNH